MPIEVDARGMRCPWPVLRLARAVREAGDGARFRVRADDPAAPRELAALAAERGWRITTLVEESAFEIQT
jgi:tRNA 2-thiouridine synthesizing protein A